MSRTPDTFAEDEALLAELAQLDMGLARKLHARAMAAEDDATVAAMSRTYQRIARSVRQTLALKEKLRTDRLNWTPIGARSNDFVPAAVNAHVKRTRAERRELELEDALERIVWTETEDERKDWLIERIDDIVSRTISDDDFAAGPLDDHVARICAELGLPPETAARWRDLPHPLDDLDTQGSG